MAHVEFKMPRQGESITEATIIQWYKQVGEFIEIDDILLEVATDKVDSEVPATISGTLVSINYQANEVVKIGEVIAVIDAVENGQETSQSNTASKPKEEIKENKPKATKHIKKNTVPSASVKVNSNVFISPLVEAMARTHHISYDELARIPATGVKGRLRKSDVTQYIEQGRPFQFVQPSSPSGFSVPDLKFDKGTGQHIPMDRMRKMISDHMVYSKHTSPHVTAYVEADVTSMAQWRNENKESFANKYEQKLTFTPLFIACIAKAITDFPMINSSLDDDTIIVKDAINIGMATALPTGNLIVPVVKDANLKSLSELAASTNELAEKARTGKLTADDTAGSTFTISNVGTFGSLMGTPIINQPEAAILATGIIKKRAEVIEQESGDTIEIRSMMYLSLSFDHRIVDGYLAGSFLKRIATYMEEITSPDHGIIQNL